MVKDKPLTVGAVIALRSPKPVIGHWDHPATCDICGAKLEKVVYDGKTAMGPWALMCSPCFHHVGVGLGLGLGKGQEYEWSEDAAAWLKTED